MKKEEEEAVLDKVLLHLESNFERLSDVEKGLDCCGEVIVPLFSVPPLGPPGGSL